ncbi:MAG: hypothetical protein ACODAQ_13140, partial [Phycisphaeraceae bacterium]
MNVQWKPEACDFPADPDTGVALVQLTCSNEMSTTIYCEQPYCTPDGNRVAIVRGNDFSFDDRRKLLVADLERIKLALLQSDFTPGKGSASIANAPWSGLLHYWVGDAVVRADMNEMTTRALFEQPEAPGPRILQSVSADQRYAIYKTLRPGPTNGIVRLDLSDGSWDIIHEDPQITNPHLQFNPIHGRQILVQHNRDTRVTEDGGTEPTGEQLGTTLFVIDADGTNRRPLPVGEPYTSGATGHECFVADTGRVCFTVQWDKRTWQLDERWPQGNLFTAAPGDKEPVPFEAPEHRFNHVCVSRCGRYFLADSYGRGLPGPVPLVMGNFETGKYRTLVEDCGAQCGGAQFTHA